jgi:hypothetical protein
MQLWGNLIHLFWTFLFVASCWDYVCPLRQRNLSDLEKAFDGVLVAHRMKKKHSSKFTEWLQT